MKKKLRLGKKTKDGYQYAASGNLGPDLASQVEKFVKEKEIKDLLKKEVDKLRKAVKKYKGIKKNNLQYYFMIGKKLNFLDKPDFSKIKQWSAFRLIYEWLPEMLPHISKVRVARLHVASMYYLGKVEFNDLQKATWKQWYEITMFPELFTNKKNYKKILALIEQGEIKGSLRTAIPRIIKNFS